MRRSLSLALFLTALTVSALPALGAETYLIDPYHTGVNFSVRHIFTMVPGRFDKFEGTFTHDAGNPTASKVDVTIDAASINTGNEKRDGHLRTADFFDVENHPKMTFKSTKVAKSGEGRLEITGDLTIRGVTKSVTLAVEFLGAGPGPDGKTRSGFHATAAIDRKDFGVNWNKTLDTGGFLLGDDVKIEIAVEGVLQ